MAIAQEDEDFQTLAEFLNECDLPITQVEHEPFPLTTTGDNKLILPYDMLTETLTSASPPVIAPVNPLNSPSNRNSERNVHQNTTETRRQIRNRQAAKRRDRYRQKMKDERHKLVEQESELTTELTKLQTLQVERSLNPPANITLSTWKAISRREMDKRSEAEEIQKRLRAEVANRSRFIRQMSAMLQGSQEKEFMPTQEINGGIPEVLKGFLIGMDSLYAQTDQIFSGLSLRESKSMSFTPIRKWNQGVECFDSSDTTVIPLSYDEACRGVSLVMLSDSGGNRYDEGIEDPDNMMASKYTFNSCFESGEKAALVIYYAMKRYIEADRLVFVWRALNEGQGEFAGLQTDETGWAIVRPGIVDAFDTDSPQPNGCPQTILESHVRLVPAHLGLVSASRTTIDRFSELVIRASEAEIKVMVELLDNLVLGFSRSI